MLITLPGPPPNAPAGCAFCGKPFRKVGAGVQIWRSTNTAFVPSFAPTMPRKPHSKKAGRAPRCRNLFGL